ncbi:MAG: glycosyltransferase family 1 protein [Spartobacteria bacterium]|nr:glycosyltransferase family 1 protein [Spartobacteria bacterium]
MTGHNPTHEHETTDRRVCLLIGSFFPRVGGGESHALELARAMNREHATVFVLTRRHDKSWPARETVNNVRVCRIGPSGMKRWGKYLMILPAIIYLGRLRKHYDVIYVCGLRVLGVAGLVAAKLFHKKCVLRAESCGEYSGEFIWGSFHNKGNRLLEGVCKPILKLRNLCYRQADAFLSIAQVITDEFRTHGVPPEKITTIPNGINIETFKPRDRAAKTASALRLRLPDKRTFAYSGKLNKGKGLPCLLAAWKTLQSTHPDIHLLLIGGGGMHFLSCEGELRNYISAHGLNDSVTLTGYVDHVADYLQASDFFVLPSESESFGIALIEAMACGLPCIATAIGGILDIITDRENGLLVPVNDENALRQAMEKLLSDPALAGELARNGRETVVNNYSIERIAQAHRAFFNHLQ